MSVVRYLRQDPPDPRWTREAFSLQLQGRIAAKIIVTGESQRLVARIQCPRCEGCFGVDRASEATYVSVGKLGDSTASQDISSTKGVEAREIIICSGPPVEGTPEGRMGCGAAFAITAEITRAGGSS